MQGAVFKTHKNVPVQNVPVKMQGAVFKTHKNVHLQNAGCRF
jgi:hypothetical protein